MNKPGMLAEIDPDLAQAGAALEALRATRDGYGQRTE